MFAILSQTLISSTTILWLVGSLMAAALLFGGINRRRSRLIESLREFVDRTQESNGATNNKDGSSNDE